MSAVHSASDGEYWIALLREDVHRFNAERAKLPEGESPSLGGADLSGLDLREANLRNTYLWKVNLAGTKLPEGQMRSCEYYQTKFGRAIWASAEEGEYIRQLTMMLEKPKTFNRFREKLTYRGKPVALISMRGADLSGMHFENVDFSGIDCTGAILENTWFRGCTVSGVCFTNANLRKVRFWGGVVEDCDMMDCDLRDASFEGVQLFRVDLSGSVLGYCNFYRARLEDCSMMDADVHMAFLYLVDTDSQSMDGALNMETAFLDPLLRRWLMEGASSSADPDFESASGNPSPSAPQVPRPLCCGYCGEIYYESKNHDEACRHHPQFFFPYDIDTEGNHQKGWQCCKSVNPDQPGCRKTRHRRDIIKVESPMSLAYEYAVVASPGPPRIMGISAEAREAEVQAEREKTFAKLEADPAIARRRAAIEAFTHEPAIGLGRPVQALIDEVGPPRSALRSSQRSSGSVSFYQHHYYAWEGLCFEMSCETGNRNGTFDADEISYYSIRWYVDILDQELSRRFSGCMSGKSTDPGKIWKV